MLESNAPRLGAASAYRLGPTNWIQRVNKKFRGEPPTFRGITISPFGSA